jgi:hypothetical protein
MQCSKKARLGEIPARLAPASPRICGGILDPPI